MSLSVEIVVDLNPGDKIEILRDTPHLAQVYKGDICTVTGIFHDSIQYQDRSGYFWTYYLNLLNPHKLNDFRKYSAPLEGPAVFIKKPKKSLQSYEKIRIYDSSFIGGSVVCKHFDVVGAVVVAFLNRSDILKPFAPKEKTPIVTVTVNKRQCARLKGKKNA